MTLTTDYQKVAESYVGNAGGVNIYLRLYARYSQQDQINNRSYVLFQTRLYCSADYFGTYSNTTKYLESFDLGSTGVQSANGTYYAGETVLLTKEGWITHNSDGNKNVGASAYFVATPWGISASVSGIYSALPKIPRGSILTSVLNYETDLTIIPIEVNTQLEAVFTKYVSSYYDKLVLKIGNTVVKTIEGITSPSIFNFTSAEVNTIYLLMSTTNSINLVAELSTYSDSTMSTQIGTTSSKTVTASIINANPLFSNFNFQDVNTNTLALTNNNLKIVSGKSNLKVVILNADMAIGQKGSTIEYYKINDVIYNNYTIVNDIKTYNTSFEQTINQYSLNNITVYAIDSRNNATQLIKAITNFIDYTSIVVSSKNVERLGSINEETKFDFTGTFWNDNFGQVINDITATYRYKETSTETWITGSSSISITKNGNNFSFSGYLKGNTDVGFGADKSYNVEIILNDKIDNEIITYMVINGIPALDVFKNNLGIHGIYDELVGGVVQIDGSKIADIDENEKLNVFANKKLGTNKELATEEYVDNKFIYSTTEQIVGKWTDGKLVYRKVVFFNAPLSANTWSAVNTSTSNISTIVKQDISILNSASPATLLNMPWYFGSGEIAMAGLKTSGIIDIYVTSQYVNRPCKIIMEYTKTTD